MKRSVVYYSLAALVISTMYAHSASADERPSWYVGLTGGYTFMTNQDISGDTTATSVHLDSGYIVGGSIGYLPMTPYPFLNNMRIEVEAAYHRNDVKSVAPSDTSGEGYYSAMSYMANAFYDLPTGTPWSPYIGGGIGVAELSLGNNPAISNSSGNDTEFAYQGMAGIGYTPSSIPGTQWTLGYRYFGTSDASFGTTGGNVDVKYAAQSIELGAKFRF